MNVYLFSGALAAALLIMQNLSALGLAAFTVQVILSLATPLATLLGDSHWLFLCSLRHIAVMSYVRDLIHCTAMQCRKISYGHIQTAGIFFLTFRGGQ